MTAWWKALRSSHKPWKSLPRFPHFHRTATATLTLKSTQKGGAPQLPALPLLQAHSSIRKDSQIQLLLSGLASAPAKNRRDDRTQKPNTVRRPDDASLGTIVARRVWTLINFSSSSSV